MVHAEVEFDFRVPHVSSINCSGHKYGLVYPGVGWVVWRNRACVDESLICEPATTSYILICTHSKAVSRSCILLRSLPALSSWQSVYYVWPNHGLHLHEPCSAQYCADMVQLAL